MTDNDHESLRMSLRSGLDAMGLVLPVPTQQRLLEHLALIGRWNRTYNLTAVRDPAAMVTQHLLDSLAVLPPLRRHLGLASALDGPEFTPGADCKAAGRVGRPRRVLDVGSGAGLPGAALAIAEPGCEVTCIDAVAKKSMFVRQVALELQLSNLQAVHARVEDLTDATGFDVVTSRAFASLADFVSLTGHVLAEGGAWMAMKGRVPQEEMAALPAGVEVFHVEPLTVPGLDAERCLIWMRKRATT